jgi:hypothetical protein
VGEGYGMTDYDQREELHAIGSDTQERYTSKGAIHTRGANTHGPSIAMCSMDTHGHLQFAGDRAAIYALQAAVAERFSADLAIHTGPIHTEG